MQINKRTILTACLIIIPNVIIAGFLYGVNAAAVGTCVGFIVITFILYLLNRLVLKMIFQRDIHPIIPVLLAYIMNMILQFVYNR